MRWVERHHVIAAVLASMALLLSVMTVGEPISRQMVLADTVTVSVAGGGLGSQELSAAGTPAPKTWTGDGLTLALQPISVGDARGSGAGWSLTLAATMASSQVPDFPANHAIIGVVTTPAVRKISGRKPPETYGGMLDDPGITMVVATPGKGMGIYEIQPILDIVMPANLSTGAVLEATLTQTFISSY